jgi:hypothetical protein
MPRRKKAKVEQYPPEAYCSQCQARGRRTGEFRCNASTDTYIYCNYLKWWENNHASDA